MGTIHPISHPIMMCMVHRPTHRLCAQGISPHYGMRTHLYRRDGSVPTHTCVHIHQFFKQIQIDLHISMGCTSFENKLRISCNYFTSKFIYLSNNFNLICTLFYLHIYPACDLNHKWCFATQKICRDGGSLHEHIQGLKNC